MIKPRIKIPQGIGMEKQERKEIVKEALKEWLDDKFAAFGKWTAVSLAAVIMAALFYFVLWINGWHR